MSELSTAMAKLSGIRKALAAVMNENVSRNRGAGEVRTRATYSADHVQHYFVQAAGHLEALRKLLPDLYSDFQAIKTEPETEMVSPGPGQPAPMHFCRAQAERLIRDIDQMFEIRANSELEQPKQVAAPRAFITHGRSNDWRVVQPFIEKDVGLPTIELAQEANGQRSVNADLGRRLKTGNSRRAKPEISPAAETSGALLRRLVGTQVGLDVGVPADAVARYLPSSFSRIVGVVALTGARA